MENLLFQIYLFVCHVYDTSAATCYQRVSNNRVPEFTDQELITIWFFAHCEGCFEKKKMHRLMLNYWHKWFPHLPDYQTFVLRLNRLEPTFQTFGAVLSNALTAQQPPEIDHLVDSLPVMLARHGIPPARGSDARYPTLGFVQRRKRAFMVSACSVSHNAGQDVNRSPLKSGSVPLRITTRQPSLSSKLS